MTPPSVRRVRYRLWLVEYRDWQPGRWNEAPPEGRVIEPLGEGTLSAAEAAAYLEQFNETARVRLCNRWAVAVPVRTCFRGDLREGAPWRRSASA